MRLGAGRVVILIPVMEKSVNRCDIRPLTKGQFSYNWYIQLHKTGHINFDMNDKCTDYKMCMKVYKNEINVYSYYMLYWSGLILLID